jgi:hypothetical protein
VDNDEVTNYLRVSERYNKRKNRVKTGDVSFEFDEILNLKNGRKQ